MAGIKSFNSFISKYGEDKTREILSQDVRVTEKFDAFRFSFEKHPKTYKFQYYGKNGKTPLNRVDRTLSDLYEEAIEYIESLPYEIRKAIPIRQRFGFSWFPSKNPLLTEYEKRPKNGLILTDITIRNNKFEVINEVQDNSVFERWSNVLRVDYAKPVFEGKLSTLTINAILESSKEPSIEMLKESEVYTPGFLNRSQENIEALVFQFEDNLLKLGKEHAPSNESRSHMFDIVLLNICEHLESFNLSNIKVASINSDEGYIEIVSEIFNDYVNKKGPEFLESGLMKPDFLTKSGELSKKWIRNPKTLAILENDNRYEYLLSIFLANLKKPRYKSGLISESVAQSFNQKIEEIDKLSGNDFGFLEFTSIQKEDREEPVNEDLIAKNAISENQNPDFVKAVSLLTKFFDPDRNTPSGETPVNVLITNANALTQDVIDEASRLQKLNGYKSIIVHSRSLFNKGYGIDPANTERILSNLVESMPDIFAGYATADRPFLKKLIDSLRPKYEPVTIYTEEGLENLRKEKEGLDLIYSSGNNADIKIEPLKNKSSLALQDSLEKDSYKDYQKVTPEFMHPYWQQIKSSFDKFYFA